MDLNLTATLILFGLLQSATMLFLIFKNRNWKQTPNRILIALLLVVGISLIPTLLGNLGLVERYDYLKYLPLNLLIFIFPLLYLYISAVFNNGFRLNKKSGLHLIIPILFAIYYILIWIGSLTVALEFKGSWVIGLGYFKVKFAYDVVLLVFVFGYAVLCFRELRKEQTIKPSHAEHRYHQWLSYLLLFFVVGALFDLTSTLLGKIYGYWKSSPLDDWLGFSLTMAVKIYNAVLLYIISLVGYLTYSTFRSNRGSFDKVVVEKQLKSIFNKMETEKPYLSKDFSLTTFSKQMQVTPAVLSNLLNNHLNITFTDFANKFRVDEVKDRIQNGAYSNFTIESIAADSGFKSKTTFYRAFYKFTSQTPKAYIGKISSKKKVS